MSRPRNFIASYVVGRSPDEVEAQARALSRGSAYEPIVGAPAGWLVAVEPAPGAPHFADANGASIEPSLALAAMSGHERARAAGSVSGLAALHGEFAFAALGEGGQLDVVRSCGGRVPIYYRVTGTTITVATRIRDLFWLCPDELQPDLLVHALWSSGNAVFPDERTFFRDVKILPKGHVLHVASGRAALSRYWEPRPNVLLAPSSDQQAEHARELREILVGVLHDELSAAAPNLLTLSGGVDSSSVAVLAARTLGKPLATLTFVAPRSSRARVRQLSFVEPLLDELAVTSRHLIDAEDAMLDRLYATPLVSLCYCPHPALRFMALLDRSFASLVSGHFADELCGYSQRLQDWVIHTPLTSLLAPHFPRRYGLRDHLRWFKRRILNRLGRELLPLPPPLGSIYAADVRAEHRAWRAKTRARMLGDARPLRELAAWVELDGWIAMHWDVGSVLGVTPVHPFFNRAALELGFRCHPVELFGPGPKKLLRRALRDVVPSRYLERQDKGHWHRPARLERAGWDGRIDSLRGCVGDLDLRSFSVTELRQLTQLALFEVALKKESIMRRSLWPT